MKTHAWPRLVRRLPEATVNSFYRSQIVEILDDLKSPDVLDHDIGAMDPRHVEAFMRSEHPTLDGLSYAEFADEVLIAVGCIRAAGPELAEALARSHGL